MGEAGPAYIKLAPGRLALKKETQSNLHGARWIVATHSIAAALLQDASKRRGCRIVVNVSEVRVIEDVLRLETNFEILGIFAGEVELLQQRRISVEKPRVTNSVQQETGITQAKIRRIGKGAPIKNRRVTITLNESAVRVHQ